MNQPARKFAFSFVAPLAVLFGAFAIQPARATPTLQQAIIRIEQTLHARIGVELLDITSGQLWAYKADDRFPVMSTYKVLACGAFLARVDAGTAQLDQHVNYSRSELVKYSPVTDEHADQGMTAGALCKAAITMSDNTAGNLVLRLIGGPQGLTGFLRAHGDGVTRLDRWETALNEAAPGDPRDTTSPAAMVATMNKLLLGSVLSKKSRAQLYGWMVGDKVADALLRASLPKGWAIADKSGAGGHGSRGIIAEITPSRKGPYLVAIYMTGVDGDMAAQNGAIRDIGRALVSIIGQP